jgi:hypothetical protein
LAGLSRQEKEILSKQECVAGVEGIELTHSCSNRSPGATGLIWEYQKTFDARMSARRQNASSQRATQLDIIR